MVSHGLIVGELWRYRKMELYTNEGETISAYQAVNRPVRELVDKRLGRNGVIVGTWFGLLMVRWGGRFADCGCESRIYRDTRARTNTTRIA